MPSSSMPWVKLYTEILDDIKLLELTDAQKWRFVQLIVLAGDLDQDGYLPFTTKKIALRLRVDLDVLEADLPVLEEADLIYFDKEQGFWVVTSFSKRQGRSQAEKREQWKKAQNKKRAQKKEVSENDQDKDHTSVINDTDMNHTPREEEEEEREEEYDAWPPAPVSLLDAEKHPAIMIYREVTGRWPGARDYGPICETLRFLKKRFPVDADLIAYLSPHWLRWKNGRRKSDGQPYDPGNITWLTDKAIGDLDAGQNGKGKDYNGGGLYA